MNWENVIDACIANFGLAGAYLVYKLCDRIFRSHCSYDREHGLEISLPDPTEEIDLVGINNLLKAQGTSMRILPKDRV